MNIYHQVYTVGEYIKLIQFCYDRFDGRPVYLRVEDLLDLIRKRKINCRYVKVSKVIMKITEKIEQGECRYGYIGIIEGSDTMAFSVAHNQYPDYVERLGDKFTWRVYKLNLGAHGRYTEHIYEEHDRVLRLIANRYVPARLRETIDPEGRGVQSVMKNRLHDQAWS